MCAGLEDEFGDIIGKARIGQGYSIEDLSRITGIKPPDILELESCRRGPSMDQVHALAGALGLDAAKLSGIANDAWRPEPAPWRAEPNAVVGLVTAPIGSYSENCYVVGCRETRRALVVDPGGSVEQVIDVLSELGLSAEAIAITHGHSDHTAAVASVARRLGIAEIIGSAEGLGSVEGGGLSKRQVADGEGIRLGALTIRTLDTPGHTRGSVCYLCGFICFVGDTLFAGSVGRAMGAPDSYRTLLDSVQSRLLSLPKETALLPGHGPATSVGEELRHNPFFS